MKRNTPIVRRTRIKRVSSRRAKQQRLYPDKRNAFLLKYPLCEVCRKNHATQVHHTEGRIGQKLLDETKFLPTCLYCHSRIHWEPKWAREMGYLK